MKNNENNLQRFGQFILLLLLVIIIIIINYYYYHYHFFILSVFYSVDIFFSFIFLIKNDKMLRIIY